MERLVKWWRWLPALPILLFILSSSSYAQQPPAPLERVSFDIWPDFDRPAVLVLITAELDASASRPATVVLPLPANATVHAVARMDVAGGLFDMGYEQEDEQISFTLESDLGFRLEYYQPYEADGIARSVDISWQALSDVNRFAFRIQQPAGATPLQIIPPPASTSVETFGLTYHNLPALSLLTGQMAELSFSYELPDGVLSNDLLGQGNVDAPPAVVEPVETNQLRPTKWTWVIAGILAVWVGAFGSYYFLKRRQPQKRKPPSRQPTAKKDVSTQAKKSVAIQPKVVEFCHQCGAKIVAGDKFCRQCGERLRQ